MGSEMRDSNDACMAPLMQEDDVAEEQPLPPSQANLGRRAAVLFALVAFAVGAACLSPVAGEFTSAMGTGIVGFVALGKEGGKASLPCSNDGEACLESQCCNPGGLHGLQCFKKNDNWAACAPSCTKDVHEPEEEGHWDETGTFIKVKWSCEKVGPVSEPGCEAFNKSSACPGHRCMWKADACMPKCDHHGNQDACWNSKQCMWEDGQCMDACWGFNTSSSCQPTSKCYWSGEKCQLGWWLFKSYDSCPQDLGYMWNGSCSLDPCSMAGEDCSKSKCCSTERGAGGSTCFQKNEFWATCQESCVASDSWSCKALGKRAKYPAGCAWAGKDCSADKLCCNRGFLCAKKDEYFNGCVQTVKQTTWDKQKIPIPSNWDGTILGAGRDEYQIAQAGENDKKLGTTLYCFIAFLPDTYEEELVDVARRNKASIFSCDAHATFHTWQTDSAGWDTGESTLKNTDVFMNVWEQVGKVGDYNKYDWTVKVDPDCVMVADRVRYHLAALNLADWAAAYVKNNGMDPGLGNNGFLGAIEIFSTKAVNIYLDNSAGCLEALGLNAGEDGFFKGCMDALGIGYAVDTNIFFPDYSAGACSNGARAAFHPIKDPAEYQHCLDIVAGNSQW